jgi:hypothetical protein
VREKDAGGRDAGEHSTTPTYSIQREKMCVCAHTHTIGGQVSVEAACMQISGKV